MCQAGGRRLNAGGRRQKLGGKIQGERKEYVKSKR